MNCDSMPDVSALLDGELDSEAASRVRLHLERCAECRSFAHDVEALRRTVTPPLVDASQAAAALRRIQSGKDPAIWRRSVPVPAPLLLAALLLFVLLALIPLLPPRADHPAVSPDERGRFAGYDAGAPPDVVVRPRVVER
jgi:anti-sigma factor RsiW